VSATYAAASDIASRVARWLRYGCIVETKEQTGRTMRGLWTRFLIPRSLGRTLLAAWLIAAGAVPLLGINNPDLNLVLHLIAITAGVLLLLKPPA
jgi:hypothetical protein